MRGLRTVVQKKFTANTFLYLQSTPASIRGSYAHFDDTNRKITLMNNGVKGPNDSSGPIWSTQQKYIGGYSGVNFYGNKVLNQGIIGRIV